MATDSRIHENKAEVISLNLVMGEENTPKWERVFNVPYLDLDLDGISLSQTDLDRHHGRTRQVRRYQAGTWAGRIVRNERQVSVATLEDLREIAEQVGIYEAASDNVQGLAVYISKMLAVNVVIDGPPDLKEFLGAGTKLMCGDPETGSIIDLSEAHLPCSKPARAIASEFDLDFETVKALFKTSAFERRGYVGSVYSPGRIALGDLVAVQLPIDHRSNRPTWQN